MLTYNHMMMLWCDHENTGNFNGSFSGKLPAEDQDANAKPTSYAVDYVAKNLPAFVKGEKDIHSDAEWATWCKTLRKYGVDKVTERYQALFDKYSLILK